MELQGKGADYEIAALIADDDISIISSKKPIDYQRFWYSIHGFLLAVANISKLLNLPGPRRVSDSYIDNSSDLQKSLREYFHVELDSVIGDRTFRNHFEHYDERLLRWANSEKPLMAATMYIGTKDHIRSQLGFSPDIEIIPLKFFNSETFSLEFFDDTIELIPVYNEVLKLKERLDKYFPHKEPWSGVFKE